MIWFMKTIQLDKDIVITEFQPEITEDKLTE
jgi:hypothetical protein